MDERTAKDLREARLEIEQARELLERAVDRLQRTPLMHKNAEITEENSAAYGKVRRQINVLKNPISMLKWEEE